MRDQNQALKGGRTCIALAFDSAMFAQGCECIKTILKNWDGNGTICVLSLGLTDAEGEWLRQKGVRIETNTGGIPVFPGAPRYALAMTCRPWLRDLFPEFDIYMWIDADVRLTSPEAIGFYRHNAAANSKAIVITQEVDPTYGFVRQPHIARNYHQLKFKRMKATYGDQIAMALEYFYCFNAGVFAMHRDSLVWAAYQANVRNAIQTEFDHMKEQDAMNVAIFQTGQVCVAPAIMNWLCSISFPAFDSKTSRWVRPSWPQLAIPILHLTNSNTVIPDNLQKMTYYQAYRLKGLTE